MWAVVARVRILAARHPVAYWALVLSFAALAVWRVHTVDTAAGARRDAWGSTTQAWVSTADTPVGEPIVAERRTLPAAMVPGDAVDDDPNGRPARRARRAGEVVLAIDTQASPIAELVPLGHVAITLEQRPLPEVSPGDAVVVVTATGTVAGTAVAVGVDTVTVAVPDDRAADIARSSWSAAATVAVAG